MSIAATFPFDNPANYSLNGIEVSGGKARLVYLRPTNVKFSAEFSTGPNARLFTVDGVGTLVNGATVSADELDLTGSVSGRRCAYNANEIVNILLNQGTIRFRVRPNYSGVPATDQYFFSAGSPTSSENAISLYHRAGGGQPGKLVPAIADKDGNTLFSAALPDQWLPVAGTEYEIEINYDVTAGTLRIFIDGALHYENLAITTGIRDAVIAPTRFNFGVASSLIGIPDFSMGSFAMFNTVQHTAPYTPNTVGDEAIPPDYATGTLETVSGLQTEAAVAFASVESVVGGGSILYGFRVAGTLMYWNGAAWVASDGSAGQLNTAADANANIASLVGAISLVKVFARITSGDDLTTSELDEFTYSYDYGAVPPVALPQCELFGFLRDLQGNPVVGATVTAILEDNVNYNELSSIVLETGDTVSVVTDSDGRLDLKLVQGATVRLTITMPNGAVVERDKDNNYLYLDVPALDFVDITTLLEAA